MGHRSHPRSQRTRIILASGPRLNDLDEVTSALAAGISGAVKLTQHKPIPVEIPDRVDRHGGRPPDAFEADPAYAAGTEVHYPDLIDLVGRAVLRSTVPSHVVVSLHPGVPLVDAARSIFDDPALHWLTELAEIVVVIDGPALSAGSGSPHHPPDAPIHALHSLAIADTVVLTRSALLSEDGLAHCRWRLRRCNATAAIVPDAALRLPGPRLSAPPHDAGDATAWLLDRADKDTVCGPVTATSLMVTDHPGGLHPDALDAWIEDLLVEPDTTLLRIAGEFSVAQHGRRCIAVGIGTTIVTMSGAVWRTSDERRSRVRVIGCGFDRAALLESLDRCFRV